VAERSGDGRDGGVPWASVFDPEANARALEQIQRRGLQAAGDLVDRLVSVVDGNGARDRGADHEPTSNGAAAPGGADPFSGWVDLMTQTVQAMARLSVPDAEAAPQPTGGPAWVDVASGRDAGTFELRVDATSSEHEVEELWLHNPSGRALGPLCIHVGELRTPEGWAVPGGVVRPDPASVPELPARSSRGVSVSIAAPAALTPGRYRGLLQIDGAGAVALRVELSVTGPG
jgi:hypothetical protein